MLKKTTSQLQLIILIVISLILLFIPVLTGFAAVKNEPSAALTESVSSFITETLQDKFKDFHWKITEINTIINFKELTDSQFEAEVLVNLKHTLNITQPEDLPVLKGKLRFLKENEGNLSKKETDFLNKDVEKWRDILKRYIKEPQDASIIIIAKGEVDQKDTSNPKNVNLYALNYLNNPVPLNEYLIPPKDADIEKDAYRAASK